MACQRGIVQGRRLTRRRLRCCATVCKSPSTLRFHNTRLTLLSKRFPSSHRYFGRARVAFGPSSVEVGPQSLSSSANSPQVWPMSAQKDPEICPDLVDTGPNVVRHRSKSAPKFGRVRPRFGQCWALPGQQWPKLAQCCPKLVGLGPNFANSGPSLPSPTSTDLCCVRPDFGRILRRQSSVAFYAEHFGSSLSIRRHLNPTSPAK